MMRSHVQFAGVIGGCVAASIVLSLATGCDSVTQSRHVEPTSVPRYGDIQEPNPAAPVRWPLTANAATAHGIGMNFPSGWYDAAVGSPATDKVIYLTFDDGPSPLYTDQLLTVLAKYKATATFFMIGKRAQQFPDVVRRVRAAGQAIGNHSWDHPHLAMITPAQVADELSKTTIAINTAGGQGTMGRCMRPPYGRIDAAAAQVAKAQGLTPVLWTAIARDWRAPPAGTIVSRLRNPHPGEVVLFHDGDPWYVAGRAANRGPTVAATAQLLAIWSRLGYHFDPVPSCVP